IMIFVSIIELTSGVFRNGVTQWYFVFGHEKPQPGAEYIVTHWGLLLAMFGIVGGFAGGMISDWCFKSRRGPPAGLLCGLVLVLSIVMAAYLFSAPTLIGWAGVGIVMAAVGITSLMSGTAAT